MAEPPLASNNPFRRNTPSRAPPPRVVVPGPEPEPEPLQALDGPSFREQLRSLPKSSQAPPSTTFQKPKPVKKVRVMSPPPSSPEDAEDDDFNARYPAAGPPAANAAESTSDDDTDDPFQADEPADDDTTDVGDSRTSPQRPPPNPFQKTLKDFESPAREGASGSAIGSPAAKGSLDVSSFQRLLMTGQSGAAPGSAAGGLAGGSPSPQAPLPPSLTPGDAGSFTDASSVSRQSIFDAAHAPQETPRTSHELSGGEDEESGLIQTPAQLLQQQQQQRPALRKKPPPPSSRHGKLIKIQLKDEGGDDPGGPVYPSSAAKSGRPSSSSSDLNKPLPLPPRSFPEEDPESVFDREAAGKIPEVDIDPDAPDELIPSPRPPTPPNASHATGPAHIAANAAPSSTPSRRPAAPPPRRPAHGRTESKAGHDAGVADEPPPRSSLESTRSASSSIKLPAHAPAPPPPRRPAHISRPSTSSFASPSAASFSSASSPLPESDTDRSPVWAPPAAGGSSIVGAVSPVKDAAHNPHPSAPSKLFPPPPPPSRHISVRERGGRDRGASDASTSTARPPSISGVEASHARSSAPPPPPPRQRGSSRGSTDGPGLGRRMSNDSVRTLGATGSGPAGASEAGITVVTEEPAETDASAADDILADLDALQREVDALRGLR